MALNETPAPIPPHTLINVTGTLSDGCTFLLPVALFDGEHEITLIERTLEAFDAYGLDVEDYKINI
jgi:hypothetical protein